MSAGCAVSIVFIISKGKCHVKSCCCYGDLKLFEHGMKLTNGVLFSRL